MLDHIPPEVRNFRWPILVLCCLMIAGKYYSFDIPAAVYDKLENRFHHFNGDFVLDFNLMYTFYCFPNVFLPLFGGHLIDKFGQRSMIIIFTSCSFMGQFIVSFGVTSRNFNLILLGRFLFGVGESINVSIITILSSYFAQGELAFAFIILFLSTRFCTFLSMLMSPIIEFEHGVSATFWIGALICSIGVVAALILAEVDDALKSPYSGMKRHNYTLDIGRGTHASSKARTNVFGSFTSSLKTKSSVPTPLPVVMEDEDDSDERCDEDAGNTAESIIAELHSKQEEGYGTFYHKSNAGTSVLIEAQDVESNSQYIEHNVQSQPMNCCPKTLICILFLCFFLYGAILPFYDMANPIIHIGYFQRHHHMTHMDNHDKELWITRLQSVPILILAICAPCIGVTVDYYGHRPSFFVLAAGILAFSHCMIAARLGDLTVLVIALILIGLAHAITVAVTWTCIQYLVPPSQQGFATGVLLSIFHLSQSLVPIVVSYMITTQINFIDSHVSKHKFVALELIDIKNCEAFFVAMSIMALFISLILFIFDESAHAELRMSGIAEVHDYELIEDCEVQEEYGHGHGSDDHMSGKSCSDGTYGSIAMHGEKDSFRSDHQITSSQVNSRQRSKSMSDTAPLTSCMRNYYTKQRNKSKERIILSNDPSQLASSLEKFPVVSQHDGDNLGNEHVDDETIDGDNDQAEEMIPIRRRSRTVSFSGDCDFTHERRAGQGQHPSILPLSIKMPQTPPPQRKMFFAHF
mmetsp:Transcript_7333/g.12325  ORF Transcript_7333/g.12325 Transcript_7333/m.12325 type:complete len:749 (-) Transcript_7333:123-2369(-)